MPDSQNDRSMTEFYRQQFFGEHTAPLEWRGKTIDSYGDLLNVMIDILDNGTKEEARKFTAHCQAHWPKSADSNLGWLTGDMNRKHAHQAFDWFGVEHPVSGKRDLTADEAFQLGKDWAAKNMRP